MMLVTVRCRQCYRKQRLILLCTFAMQKCIKSWLLLITTSDNLLSVYDLWHLFPEVRASNS